MIWNMRSANAINYSHLIPTTKIALAHFSNSCREEVFWYGFWQGDLERGIGVGLGVGGGALGKGGGVYRYLMIALCYFLFAIFRAQAPPCDPPVSIAQFPINAQLEKGEEGKRGGRTFLCEGNINNNNNNRTNQPMDTHTMHIFGKYDTSLGFITLLNIDIVKLGHTNLV